MARPHPLRLNLPTHIKAFTDERTIRDWREGAAVVRAEEGRDDDSTITCYEVIGYDYWTGGGFTQKRLNAALRKIGDRDVTLNINSPGGDLFEGIGILNELLMHPGKVTVNVVGMAASAASVIAMAGDTVTVGKGAQIMIHEAWSLAFGTGSDMRESADFLDRMTDVIAELYAERGNLSKAEFAAMMSVGKQNLGTWFSAEEAIEAGLADAPYGGKLGKDDSAMAAAAQMTKREAELALTRKGFSRTEARAFLNQFPEAPASGGGKQDAAPRSTQDAGALPWADDAQSLIAAMRR